MSDLDPKNRSATHTMYIFTRSSIFGSVVGSVLYGERNICISAGRTRKEILHLSVGGRGARGMVLNRGGETGPRETRTGEESNRHEGRPFHLFLPSFEGYHGILFGI